ncbi:uncharacterized protein Dwil_GK14810 [Drosophila willistoni]|uniref:Choline/carnitine acyltransferase domain-containing protein n=2 Tax=Drosophila willistoni TaxID=7260 RepID=B4MUH0_DROWI|nr:uncharacterized protein Dwil_GK14810 [Drosophila willistoni]
MVDDHKIPVVKMCQYELDNSQFGKIFGGVRVPMPCMDAIEQYNDSDYVIVINKNNFYKLPVYNGDGKIVHAHALRDQLDGIVNGPSERGDTMGLLTHDSRDNWAEVHELLMHDQDNCHILDVIEKALFAVCLDEYVDLPPEGEQRNLQAAHLLHGGGRHLNSANRWMDKTLQLIVNPNGFSGICFEHSPADCQPLAMLMDLLQKNIRQPGYGCESCNDGKVEPFTPLIFKPLNQCTELWMSVAERNIDDLCKHFQLNVFKFHCHGKNFIMAQGLNTDSYIQIALQLAFFLMHEEMPSQYESAHLRIFEGGRTETIRSTTIESSAFIKSMTLPTTSKKDRMEALRAAVDAHQELTKLALLGRGVDRHLFGLQQMAKENGLPLPEFFKSPAYLKSINYRVLSSQVATTHDAFLAFGPLTPCGYGCCYNPRNNDIIFSISNWNTHKKTSAEVYGQAINTALHHMRKLVLETGGDRGSIELCKCDGKSDKK